jgi:hypothetical protein
MTLKCVTHESFRVFCVVRINGMLDNELVKFLYLIMFNLKEAFMAGSSKQGNARYEKNKRKKEFLNRILNVTLKENIILLISFSARICVRASIEASERIRYLTHVFNRERVLSALNTFLLIVVVVVHVNCVNLSKLIVQNRFCADFCTIRVCFDKHISISFKSYHEFVGDKHVKLITTLPSKVKAREPNVSTPPMYGCILIS